MRFCHNKPCVEVEQWVDMKPIPGVIMTDNPLAPLWILDEKGLKYPFMSPEGIRCPRFACAIAADSSYKIVRPGDYVEYLGKYSVVYPQAYFEARYTQIPDANPDLFKPLSYFNHLLNKHHLTLAQFARRTSLPLDIVRGLAEGEIPFTEYYRLIIAKSFQQTEFLFV